MKIKENENARILALFHQIRERQERDNEHTNYKDAPALHEMADLIRPYIGKPEQEDLADIAAVCLFLGNRYREMMRGAYAAEFFTAAFCAAVASVNGTDEELENAEEMFRDAVKARNRYVDDSCEDLKQAAAGVMAPETIEKAFAESAKRTLKHDPVEMTPEYLAVIDEVEKKVEENMTTHGRGSCHERWALTREFLEEKGIEWRSQGAMNPGWRFD